MLVKPDVVFSPFAAGTAAPQSVGSPPTMLIRAKNVAWRPSVRFGKMLRVLAAPAVVGKPPFTLMNTAG